MGSARNAASGIKHVIRCCLHFSIMFKIIWSATPWLHHTDTMQFSRTACRIPLLMRANWRVEPQMAWLKTKDPLRVHELMHKCDKTVQGSEVGERRGCRCTAPAGRQRSRSSGPTSMTSPFAHVSLSRCSYTGKSARVRTHPCVVSSREADFTLTLRQMTSLCPSLTKNKAAQSAECWGRTASPVDFVVYWKSKAK